MINIYDRKTSYKEALISNGVYDLNKMMISAETTEDIYGNYELNMEIELQGDAPTELYEMLQVDNIVKVNDEGSEELFRIAQVNKGLDFIEVYCRHITISDSLNLWLNNVRPTNENGQAALQHLTGATTPQCNLLLTSDIAKQATANYVRKNLYEALCEGDNAFINRWGGEIKRTGYTIQINGKIGQDKSDVIKIQEALNLTEFNAKSNIDEVSTVIYPIGFDGITAERVESPLKDKYSMEFPIEIKYEDVKVKKPAEEGQTQEEEGYDTLEEAQAELRRRATEEFSIKNLDKLKFECDIDYIDLEKYEEYKDLSALQTAFLGDIISVRVNTFDMDIKARIVARKYDVLRNKRLENTISTEGTLKKPESIKDIIKDIIGIEKEESWEGLGSYIDGMIQQGFKNGFVVYEKNAVYAVDRLPKEQAKNVVVLNKHGLGYSSKGISGPFTYGFTIDGKLNASMITTGTLHGQYIGAGTIEANKLTVAAKEEITEGMATNTQLTELKADVEGVKAEVTKVTTKVNGFKVGAHNYVQGSNFTYDGKKEAPVCTVEAPTTFRNKAITISFQIRGSGKFKRAGFEPRIQFTSGEIRHLSTFVAKEYYGNETRVSATFNIRDEEIQGMDNMTPIIDTLTEGWVEIGRPQIEIGTVATDYNPNSMEVEAKVNKAIVDIQPDKITSTVMKTSQFTNYMGNKVNKDTIISEINQTAEQIKIQASKIALNGAVTVSNADDNHIKIEDADYSVFHHATRKASFGIRSEYNNNVKERIPNLKMGYYGVDNVAGDNPYYIQSAYPPHNNPQKDTNDYFAQSYKCVNSNLGTSSGAYMGIKFSGDGSLWLQPLSNLIITSNKLNGQQNGLIAKEIARFDESGNGYYKGHLQTDAVINKNGGWGCVLGDERGTTEGYGAYVSVTYTSRGKDFGPLTAGDVNNGTSSYPWAAVYSNQAKLAIKKDVTFKVEPVNVEESIIDLLDVQESNEQFILNTDRLEQAERAKKILEFSPTPKAGPTGTPETEKTFLDIESLLAAMVLEIKQLKTQNAELMKRIKE